MTDDRDMRDETRDFSIALIIEAIIAAIAETDLWKGKPASEVTTRKNAVQVIILVILHVLSKLGFELSLYFARQLSPGKYGGLALFSLSLVAWGVGTLVLWKMIRLVGLCRIILALVIGYTLVIVGMALLSYSTQSFYQVVMPVAEQVLWDTGQQVKVIVTSLIQAPGKFYDAYTSQSTLPGADHESPGPTDHPTWLLPVAEPSATLIYAPSTVPRSTLTPSPASAAPAPVVTDFSSPEEYPYAPPSPVEECTTSSPLLLPDCPRPQARLTAPLINQVIRDETQVMGTANIENLDYYKFEFRREDGEVEDEWHFVEGFTTPVEEGVLGTWHVSHLPAGRYTFRLTVVKQDGNYPPPCDVQVFITH